MDAGYFLAFMTGLAGGFGHCIGMCGPVVASYALAGAGSSQGAIPAAVMQHLFYNAGRITTYSLLGAVMGLTGSFINVTGSLAGIQNAVAVLAGFMMLVMGLNITGIWGSTRWIEKHNLRILLSARQIQASTSPLRSVLLGLILGLLPCGLSYTIFIAAAGTGSTLGGVKMALLFGLGTLPALLTFGALISVLGSSVRAVIYRAGGVLVIVMGLYYLWRGIRTYAGL